MAFVSRLPARLPSRPRAFRGSDHGRRIRGGRAGRVLPQPRLEFRDPRLQRDDLRLLLGDNLQQQRDDTQRLLQRPGSQIGRKRRHTTTGTLSAPYAHYIFDCGECTS